MKTKYLPLFLIVLINIGFLLSLYWFPVTRDEFYYLDKSQLPYVFSEYWDSYNHVNPRSGQFFLNIVARSKMLKVIFGFLLFNGFLWALFANVFRQFPKISQKKDAWKFLILTAAFIFLINYFGELFYYSPFATNYTFTHVLYLLYLFVMTEYFIFQRNILPKSGLKIILLSLVAFVTGMGNEHVPPILLLFSGVCGVIVMFKNKKLPDLNIMAINISVALGYLALFFAPANTVKYRTVGKTQYGFSFEDYFATFTKILKFYYYFNFELIFITVISFLGFAYLAKRKLLNRREFCLLLSCLFLAILAILIISYSPLTGTRLMFFSTMLIIIVIAFIANRFVKVFEFNSSLIKGIAAVWLVVFFMVSSLICFQSDKIYKSLSHEILEKKKISDEVVINEQLNYFKDNYSKFNRRVLFENGIEYIDKNPHKNTAEEKNIIKYFDLKSLSHK
ncbi:hypothetical protein CHRY9390_01171 [Chryseobacterium aquaeductus]|uniref:Transmembrane protein n=1 Tax=Chryseobacterium aquaeductus TaxID=2675056 RepID=A0A9N8MFA3_9FLAO|nr:DUF6056 family protein [Chryseobacterium aquaeductus]CAA7330500.1 hypothetical protein CHRY9390_01171 [Chryseobacterium potabilaquae]CAD7804072.1 hypothetical protein CHRY9390_01171 [Chryseobacterium aquaeductus]